MFYGGESERESVLEAGNCGVNSSSIVGASSNVLFQSKSRLASVPLKSWMIGGSYPWNSDRDDCEDELGRDAGPSGRLGARLLWNGDEILSRYAPNRWLVALEGLEDVGENLLPLELGAFSS